MHPEILTNIQRVTRRQLFGRTAQGIGAAALAWLFNADAFRAMAAGVAPTTAPHAKGAGPLGHLGQPGLPGLPHHRPTAKRVVCLWQGGGPSHVDLFDYKPTLQKMAGKDIPDSV